MPLFDNLGTYSKPISTRVPAAQAYFDQGVRLLYGFNHMEAMLAFREAGRLDPDCAICWWGVATSYGPDINQNLNEERWRAAAALRRPPALSGFRSRRPCARAGRLPSRCHHAARQPAGCGRAAVVLGDVNRCGGGDDQTTTERFAAEVAPAVRDLVPTTELSR